MKSKAIKIVVTTTAILVVLAFSISAISQPSATYESLTAFRFTADGDNGMYVNWYDENTDYIVRSSKNVAGLTFDEYDIAVLEYAADNNYITSSISLDFDNFANYTYNDLYSMAYDEGFVKVRWYFYLTYNSYNNQDLEITSVGLGTDDILSTEIIPVDYGMIGSITGAPHTTYIYQCTTEVYPDDFDDGSAHLHTRVSAILNGSMPDSIVYGITTRLWFTSGEFEGDQTGTYYPPGWQENQNKLDENQSFLNQFSNIDKNLNQSDISNAIGIIEAIEPDRYLSWIIKNPDSSRFYRRLVLFVSPFFLGFAMLGYLMHGKRG